MKGHFNQLSFDLVLSSLEKALGREDSGRRATGKVVPLNSLENRVFEIEFEDDLTVVTKFYRPERWSTSQILAEHTFLEELRLAEVPTVPALPLSALQVGPTVGQAQEYYFAVFPKVRGRIEIDPTEEQLVILGRTLGRLHGLGYKKRNLDRPRLGSDYGRRNLATLERLPQLSPTWRSRYVSVANPLLEKVQDHLDSLEPLALHGDFHPGNVLWIHDRPHVIDFDDMLIGPAAQDLWLISRGRDEASQEARKALRRGYAEFREPPDTEKAIELLRFLRILNFSAWIGERFEDQSFQRTFPTFGTDAYWQSEIESLSEIGYALDQVTLNNI